MSEIVRFIGWSISKIANFIHYLFSHWQFWVCIPSGFTGGVVSAKFSMAQGLNVTQEILTAVLFSLASYWMALVVGYGMKAIWQAYRKDYPSRKRKDT